MWGKCRSGDNTVNGMMSLFSQSLRSDEAKLISSLSWKVMVGVGEMLLMQGGQ